MPIVGLSGRTIIDVLGVDAEHLLQNIITTDLDDLDAGEASAAALLSPQGKILFDFLVSRSGEDSFALECRADIGEALIRRLTLYRLRAQAKISERKQSVVRVSWRSDSTASEPDSDTNAICVCDSRFPEKLRVFRCYGAQDPVEATPIADWTALRIRNAVAESGTDYALGETFPHDVLLDQNGGISFKKGCYVGQEVVSRMQHRGSARRRILVAEGSSPLPDPGTEIRAGLRPIGILGSVVETHGLALVRIDRVKEAMVKKIPILADTTRLTLLIPPGAHFEFPDGPISQGTA